MPTALEYLDTLNRQIECCRLALDERRSLLRLMEQQGEDTRKPNGSSATFSSHSTT